MNSKDGRLVRSIRSKYAHPLHILHTIQHRSKKCAHTHTIFKAGGLAGPPVAAAEHCRCQTLPVIASSSPIPKMASVPW